MFYLTEAHIKPPLKPPRPKMTKEEAKEFLANKRAYYRSYPDEYPIPLSRNPDYQAWVRWTKANTFERILYNFNFMSAEKGLALPLGTKVRMICDYGDFRSGDIITRVHCGSDNNRSVRFETEDSYGYLKDHQWELIEGPKQDWLIQDTNGNLTKSNSFRTPKQGDKVQVGEVDGFWYETLYNFVCLYKNKVLVEEAGGFLLYDQWRFPQEEVTLSDGKTYLVVDRDGEKILKLK